MEPPEKRPNRGDNLRLSVQRLLAAGELAAAAALCEEAGKEATWSEVWFLRGFVHDVAHEHEQMAKCMRRALALEPGRADAWLFLAEWCYRTGDFQGAFEAFDQVCALAPGSPMADQAATDKTLLARNLRCVLVNQSLWPESASAFTEFEAGDRPQVWDGVLSLELLELLRHSVDDLCVWRAKNPKKMSTFWLDRRAEPRTAAEVAGRILLKLAGKDPDDFAGIEWWGRNQCARMGAHFHYDTAISGCESDDPAPRPVFSSVLYLGDVGGPTVILQQVADGGCHVPAVPARGWAVATVANRWLCFDGRLRHGACSFGLREPRANEQRQVLLYNYWKLRPAPPSCQVPHFEDYLPVCGVSPTAQYLLPASRVSSLVQTGLGEATEVEAQELLRHEDVEAQASFAT
ncbi:unnamed protein product [Effrenium voratum]|nr:unnamed protein product [Effrenium voratum]